MSAIPYEQLAPGQLAQGEWDAFVRDALVPLWLAAYETATPWDTEVLEVELEAATYLFDAAPTLSALDAGDDRVVAAWGHSRPASGPRDQARQAGFIPSPATWSGAGRDRGHLIAHAAGGGLDINLFPQAAGLNRAHTEQGRAWRAMERYCAEHAGTGLFVRPDYEDPTWVPRSIEYGLLAEGRLRCESFANYD